jgi:hypothetical protein
MEKIKDFDLIFRKPRYGWSNFVLKNQKKRFFNIAISGVYNPYYELSDILANISQNKRKKQILEIDSEGLISTIEFSLFSYNMIKIRYQCESNRKNIHEDITLIIPKNKFLKIFKNKMLSYSKKYNRLRENEDYDLSMPIKTIKKIKVK